MSICKQREIDITFNDKYKNFSGILNQCCCAGNDIECSKFSDHNHDLLVFAVLHELGHIDSDKHYTLQKEFVKPPYDAADDWNMHTFGREFKAWDYAITEFNRLFNRNISIKMARYMTDCLNSYIPDYNSYRSSKWGKQEVESNFWCPIKKRVFH